MKRLAFLLLTLLPLKAGALELLLEENRGESGTIGYVDIDRVFKEYSGTTGAREEFISEIKRKEDAVNAKKAGIFTLKAELAKLRQEREFALTLPSLLETQKSVAEAAAKTSTQTVRLPVKPEVTGSTEAAQAAAEAVPASTETAAAAPLPANLRGLPGLDGIDMPGVVKVPVNHFKFSVSTAVPEIDAAIAKKEEALRTKEEELRVFQRMAERELLEYESRRSEILLGRIYVALRELAVKEEVSVIVDKRNILFGQNAVDLTGKLLKKLEEPGI
ncbi:MAG: OmpH family outer membrane protein [Elusimicrobia bacterium]|nr:OmpH family outer membrane protein [Elusimicrobiota bacterium]